MSKEFDQISLKSGFMGNYVVADSHNFQFSASADNTNGSTVTWDDYQVVSSIFNTRRFLADGAELGDSTYDLTHPSGINLFTLRTPIITTNSHINGSGFFTPNLDVINVSYTNVQSNTSASFRLKTNSNGNEEWRKRYPSFTGGRGWIHKTEDGGYFLVDGGAVMKLDMIGNICHH